MDHVRSYLTLGQTIGQIPENLIFFCHGERASPGVRNDMSELLPELESYCLTKSEKLSSIVQFLSFEITDYSVRI